MVDYYRTTFSSEAHRSGRSAIGIIVDLVLGAVSVVVAILFFFTLLVPRLDPRGWNYPLWD